MSHSSGISVSGELLDRFAKARAEGGIRWIKAVIQDESVVYVTDHPRSENLEKDYRSIAAVLEPKEPCYVLFRLDEGDASSAHLQKWLLITFAPDIAKVKEKMLIASTRDNAKKQLGLSFFVQELYGSKPEEVSYEEYLHSQSTKHMDTVLTATEMHLKAEVNLEVHHGVAREYVHSVQFPMDKQAVKEVQNLKAGTKTFVQMEVDPNKETIDFVKASTVGVADLVREVPADKPSFTLFQWNHKHNNATERAILFIYCCPMSSQVKLKMLYSTVNKAAISAIEEAGIKITNKIEVDNPAELTEEELYNQVHPNDDRPTLASKAKFDRPMRPGRGRARMTRK
jgi:twinfilin-like protein